MNTSINLDYIDSDEYIARTDCSTKHPLLRYIADEICANRLRCGYRCKNCKAYDSAMCTTNSYWKTSSKKEIKSDLIEYFGEETYAYAEKCVKEKYVDSGKINKKDSSDDIDNVVTAQIIESYKSGDSIYKLSQKYFYSTNTISKILKRCGMLNYKANKRAERNEEIKSKYLEGTSLADLSKQYGLSEKRLSDILKAMGIYTVLNDKNMSMYNDFCRGMGEKDISIKYGTTVSAVIRILTRVSEVIAEKQNG